MNINAPEEFDFDSLLFEVEWLWCCRSLPSGLVGFGGLGSDMCVDAWLDVFDVGLSQGQLLLESPKLESLNLPQVLFSMHSQLFPSYGHVLRIKSAHKLRIVLSPL